jgi:hypothetical protein
LAIQVDPEIDLGPDYLLEVAVAVSPMPSQAKYVPRRFVFSYSFRPRPFLSWLLLWEPACLCPVPLRAGIFFFCPFQVSRSSADELKVVTPETVEVLSLRVWMV